MKKFINKNNLNIDLLYSCFGVNKQDIIGAFIDTNYFKIYTIKKGRVIKNGCNTKYRLKTFKSTY